MDTCEHGDCPEPRGKRSPFCPEHKAEHRRAWNRDRMRRKREEHADKVLGVTAVSDGRTVPGQGADAHQPTTMWHPSRRFERQDEPAVVSYLTGAAQRESIHQGPAARTDLQRYRAPSVEGDSWAPEQDQGYYDGVDFRQRNDMSQGPYSGGNMGSSGYPAQFLVVRRAG